MTKATRANVQRIGGSRLKNAGPSSLDMIPKILGSQ